MFAKKYIPTENYATKIKNKNEKQFYHFKIITKLLTMLSLF